MPRRTRSAEDIETARNLRKYVRERVRGMGQKKAQQAVARGAARQAKLAAKRKTPLKRQAKGLSLTDVNYIIATTRKKGYPVNAEFTPYKKRTRKKPTVVAKKSAPAPVRRASARVAGVKTGAPVRTGRKMAARTPVITIPLPSLGAKRKRAPKLAKGVPLGEAIAAKNAQVHANRVAGAKKAAATRRAKKA